MAPHARPLGLTEPKGKALFLVGPSSAGKTCLGHALLAALPDPYVFYEADAFGPWYPHHRAGFATMEMETRVTHGAALAIRGYLDAGVNVIVERSLWWPAVRRWVAQAFQQYPAWLVGLRWELEVLEQRGLRRNGGIFPGTVRSQVADGGFEELPYDLVVNAVDQAPDALAPRWSPGWPRARRRVQCAKSRRARRDRTTPQTPPLGERYPSGPREGSCES